MKITLPEKLTDLQLLKKFPAFYKTRRFITAFTRVKHFSLSWTRLVQYLPTSQFLKIRFSIILLSTPRFSKFSLLLRFAHQYSISTCQLHSLISLFVRNYFLFRRGLLLVSVSPNNFERGTSEQICSPYSCFRCSRNSSWTRRKLVIQPLH